MQNLKQLPKFINSKNLILRNFELDDANDIYEYAHDEKNVKWISIHPHQSLLDAFNAIKNYFLNPPEGKYVILLKEENKVIGAIDVRSRDNGTYDIGYILNAKFQNRGFGTEALTVLVKTIFETTSIRELIIKIDAENQASNHLATKIAGQPAEQVEEFSEKFQMNRTYNVYLVRK